MTKKALFLIKRDLNEMDFDDKGNVIKESSIQPTKVGVSKTKVKFNIHTRDN